MRSQRPGKNISRVEIGNISTNGVWILVDGREYFLDYDHFPWFQNATLQDIFDVELLHEGHLYWPKLDVDLAQGSLEDPDKYPLVSNA